MKKVLSILLAVLLVLALFTGCASSSKDEASLDTVEPDIGYSTEDYSGTGDYSVNESTTDSSSSGSGADTSNLFTVNTVTDSISLAEKIIYSASGEIETIDFDKTITDINSMINTYDAFIESSYVSGANYSTSYYGYQTYRTAQFVIRVPVESFSTFSDELDTLGNVTYLSTNAENITSQYTDVESRLTTYRTEEERLLTMLESAETVEDMIAVETRLSEVRYNIESLTTTLKNWQNQIDYSTVMLDINEVEELTEAVEVHRTYWQEIYDGLISSLKGVGSFFKWFLKTVIIALPILLTIAVIVVIILIIVLKSSRKKKKMQNPAIPLDRTIESDKNNE